MKWKPVLGNHPDLLSKALDALGRIAEDLETWVIKERVYSANIGDGYSGIALFFHYLHQFDREKKSALLAKRAARLATRYRHKLRGTGLILGRSGYYWAAEHMMCLPASLYLEKKQFEMGLLKSLYAPKNIYGYDVINGFAGQAVYFAAMDAGSEIYWNGLLRSFAKIAETSEKGMVWKGLGERKTFSAEENSSYHFGIAHGNAGVLSALTLVSERLCSFENARELVNGLMRWLTLNRALFLEDSSRKYSERTKGHDSRRIPAALAWCNGQPGLAFAMIRAGLRFKNTSWITLGRRIGLRSMSYFSTPERYRESIAKYPSYPGLCHGCAGLSQMYARLYQYTGDIQFRDAALFWIKETLNWQTPHGGIGGYGKYLKTKSVHGLLGRLPIECAQDGSLKWKSDPGFLTGSSGVGLALLAACTPNCPDWDRVMLLSSGNP